MSVMYPLLALTVLCLVTSSYSQGGESDQCTCDTKFCTTRAVDVIVVLDETKSMAFELLWSRYILQQLELELTERKLVGVDSACPNRYAIFGFGYASTGCPKAVRETETSDVFMPLRDLLRVESARAREPTSSCEDGYAALDAAMSARRRSIKNACVKTLAIFVSDEHRTKCGCSSSSSLTKKSLLRGYFKKKDVELAMVLDQEFKTDDGRGCLGMSYNGTCYLPVASTYHDFTLGGRGTVGKSYLRTNNQYTKIGLKRAVGGSVWDINMVRRWTSWHVGNAVRAHLQRRMTVCEPPTTERVPTPPPPPTTTPAPEAVSEPPRIPCPVVQRPPNGVVSADVIGHSTIYSFTCHDGFAIRGGPLVLQCDDRVGTLSGPVPQCVDIDECSEGSDSCSPRSTCINTLSSYQCQCHQGYIPDFTNVCINENECSAGESDCDSESTRCIDAEGSFSCSCLSGFQPLNRTHCQNVDECMERRHRCHGNALCTDTLGSYECRCRDGYSGTGTTCVNENECSTGESDCNSASTRCRDSDGSFSCSCRSGFEPLNRTHCQNADECMDGGHRCHNNALCTDTPGSYECQCRDGYSGNGRMCFNDDECRAGTDNCGPRTVCVDTVGSYRCQCVDGYERQTDDDPCQNVDECRTDRDNCHENAFCMDTPGSFNCQCQKGFTGDGVNTCSSACTAPDGSPLKVGEKAAIHSVSTPPPNAATMSACVVFTLTVKDSNGLPNGISWVPTHNISHRLNARAEELNFRNNRFCLVTDRGAATGTTERVGSTSMCGTASELITAVNALQSTPDTPDLAQAINGQLHANQTCAGQLGFLTVMVSLVPYTPVTSESLESGQLVKRLLDRDGVMLLFGGLGADHPDAELYIVGMDYNGFAYEGHPTRSEFTVHDDAAGSVNNFPEEDAGYLLYTRATFDSGGIALDSNWFVDVYDEYRRSIEAIFLSFFGQTLLSLRDSSCAVCTCESPGNVQCAAGHHVIVPSVCKALYGPISR